MILASSTVVSNIILSVTLCCAVPDDPRHIIVQKLAIVVDGRPDIEVNLTGE